ncbi:DUF4283 domain-containing protein [Cephalotus follicularis]|uniref:DUF4283 domain-containing protein n=1 Tax=Cephalotus follicularis TaxID=3775 RepID=A0A1Q3D429_CEPFO|nr:DUF4283 domain-containing protein [Cephalotus follicularis]
MNIPMEYWTPRGLNHLASVLGTPLHMDPATEAKQMISFARICVEMTFDRAFLDVIKTKRMSGDIVEGRVEYYWKPLVYERCKVFDHNSKACPIRSLPISETAKGAPDTKGWVKVKGKGKEKVGEEVTPLVPKLKPTLKIQGSYVPPRNIEAPRTPTKQRNSNEVSPDTAPPNANPLAIKVRSIEGQLQIEPIKSDPKTRLVGEVNQIGSSSGSRKKKKKSLPTGQSRNPH